MCVWGQSGNRVVTEGYPELTVEGQPDHGPPLALGNTFLSG